MSRPATAGRRGDHGSHHHNSLRIQYLGSWLHGSRMVGIFNLIAGPGHRGDLALAAVRWLPNDIVLAENSCTSPLPGTASSS
jgi:hypothetical protein